MNERHRVRTFGYGRDNLVEREDTVRSAIRRSGQTVPRTPTVTWLLNDVAIHFSRVSPATTVSIPWDTPAISVVRKRRH